MASRAAIPDPRPSHVAAPAPGQDVRPYPSDREADVVLRDGSTVRIRPLRPEDYSELLRLLESLSQESRYFRFFGGGPNLAKAARDWANVDYRERFGLVATAGPNREIIAHALYMATQPGRAEAAFEVRDAYQGRGLGSILLGQLAEYAASMGIETFEASVLAGNRKMIEVFRDSGFPVHTHADSGVTMAEFPTSLTPEAIDRFERREQVAAGSALGRFFRPRSIAVVGASRDPAAPAGQLFHNLMAGGFQGPVYPVNPKATSVQAVRAYASVRDIPDEVDMAVICVPAVAVPQAAAECAEKGVAALVVVSAGFAESGKAGSRAETELLKICRESGMRLIGPNCLGIINTSPDVSMNAIFSDAQPVAGRVGFMSQSGALGISVLEHASKYGLGISTFVSAGNKADISGNDLLSYWETDPDTDLILLYLESFGNPRKFARLARRVARTKPIIAVKAGRSTAGSRAAGSHTAALLAASDVTVDALFHQAGVIRTDTLAEMFAVARLLATQAPPRGSRVVILTNAGGPAILCADALQAAGMEVPEAPAGLQSELRQFMAPAAALRNPLDMLAGATPDDYARALRAIAKSGQYDAAIVIHIDIHGHRSQEVLEAVDAVASRGQKEMTLAAVLMSAGGDQPRSTVPVYAFPEEAAIALGHAARYGRFLREPDDQSPKLDGVDPVGAAQLVAAALEAGGGWLDPTETSRLLACYGIRVADWEFAPSPAQAGRASARLGGTVALKAVADGLVHKTEASAVRLDLHGASAVQRAAIDMAKILKIAGRKVKGFQVQRMVDGGVELILGAVQDPSFGPVVACGAGGITAELIQDVAVALTPVTEREATRMLRSLRTYPLLAGFRGAPPADLEAVGDVVVRLAAMADRHEAIAEIDLNPLAATPEGAVVLDARVRVAAPQPRPPILARRRPQSRRSAAAGSPEGPVEDGTFGTARSSPPNLL